MHLDRRRFLQSAGVLAGAAVVVPRVPAGAAAPKGAPQTGFEQRGGASWTTHEEELAFLKAVAAGSKRVRVEVIGRTDQGRPLHLVSIGSPTPRGTSRPTAMFVGSQHGNEPAGRETSLQLLRDLAFTTDATLLRQLSEQTVLVVPSANPDGREANSRTNSAGVDINRDHLALTQPETQAMHTVLRDLRPDVVLDLHEYGPSVPVLYDDEVLYLWPRNLNVDPAVRDLSRTLAEEYIGKGARAAGFTADEYGLFKAGPQEVVQTAGDEDEGICRNAVGLRHHLGILVESAVTQDPRNGPGEATTAGVQTRRVASQTQVAADTLRFMREQGAVARLVSESAPRRKADEGRRRNAPVYFGGADNSPPTAAQVVDPPPAAYLLTAQQAKELATTLRLHGIVGRRVGGKDVRIEMGQPAEPVIPLLLDARGQRHVAEGRPV